MGSATCFHFNCECYYYSDNHFGAAEIIEKWAIALRFTRYQTESGNVDLETLPQMLGMGSQAEAENLSKATGFFIPAAGDSEGLSQKPGF
ncbi:MULTISPECIES: hypothetical protein [unclassified Microcoleus]|uniref:hypothetical protein n=2 Tax=Microcoleus TaxID=44471 RepID=UPI0025EA9209|nr:MULTISPECIES: hypothetical protein [unclassified Microcoleus]